MFRTSKLIALLSVIVIPTSYTLNAQDNLPAGGQQPAAASQPGAAPAADPQMPVYSYAIGLEIGKNFKDDDVELDFDSLLAGIKDAIANAQPKYDQATCLKALQQLGEAKAGAAVAQNKKFLEENKKAEGVTTLPSGLQYKVLQSGDGATPGAEDTVRTHYKGTLIDGTEFDSSYKRNQPTEFPLNGVIPCWTEGVGKMKVGGKAKLVCPYKIAYGEGGRPPQIPGGATLVFEVELLSIKPAAAKPTGMPGMPGQ